MRTQIRIAIELPLTDLLLGLARHVARSARSGFCCWERSGVDVPCLTLHQHKVLQPSVACIASRIPERDTMTPDE